MSIGDIEVIKSIISRLKEGELLIFIIFILIYIKHFLKSTP